ncbi:MAG TPA: hypothetical protein VII94_05685 [Candidatus Saccharimonadales bacterium]
MPVLENFTLSASPVSIFLENVFIPYCKTMVDIAQPTPNPLFQSVSSGIDSVLLSAINGTPSPSECPLMRIFYDPHDIVYGNTQNVGLFQTVPLQCFILFSLDYPSPSFQELREDYITTIINYLKYDVFGDGLGMRKQPFWAWDSTKPTVRVTHDTQLRYLGKTINITPSSDFSCSRLDLNVTLKNYITAADLTTFLAT